MSRLMHPDDRERYFRPTPGFVVIAACGWRGFLLATVWFCLGDSSVLQSSPPDYRRDIKPILEKRCYSCHGRLKQKADLRLDAGFLVLKGGKDGPAAIPGDSRASKLIQRITASDEAERMPTEGKPLSSEQITLIRDWIDAGAKFPTDEIPPSSPAEHWAFQPLRRPSIPRVKDAEWCRNGVDRFILARLEARGWKPAPDASRPAWIRRAYLDLVGLPPSPEAVDAFVGSNRGREEILNQLLADPRYGERWARHWLDLVRYADSNGYERDAAKPFVWRYRDYVVNALNSDKGFDRFVIEQIAGDELTDRSAETVIATGVLRLGQWDDEPADPAADRYDQLDDVVSTTSQVFLGLTLGCARCHDHKFEPLSTRDYYSMVAVFNPLKRPQNGRTELVLPAGSFAELEAVQRRDREIERLKLAKNDPQVTELRQATPDLPMGYFLQEPSSKPPETRVLLRGNPLRPGDKVVPAVPAIAARRQPDFPEPASGTSRRRLGLAQWIVQPDNPLTARVLVNRVWQQHFGIGLVRTPSDFGLMGEPPTHPELLDWLADWFIHEGSWSLKKLHRLILSSRSWEMSRQANSEYIAADPENRLLSFAPYRRLEVEAIRDSILSVSGQLNQEMSGPSMFPTIPAAALEANTDKDTIWKASGASASSRRTLYAFIKRGLVVPLLEVMDLSDTVQSCARRLNTTVAPQALTLFNGEFVNQQAAYLAQRLRREAGPDPVRQIHLGYRLALGRPAHPSELTALRAFLQQESAANGRRDGDPDFAALVQLSRVLFNLNEFVYPE